MVTVSVPVRDVVDIALLLGSGLITVPERRVLEVVVALERDDLDRGCRRRWGGDWYSR